MVAVRNNRVAQLLIMREGSKTMIQTNCSEALELQQTRYYGQNCSTADSADHTHSFKINACMCMEESANKRNRKQT